MANIEYHIDNVVDYSSSSVRSGEYNLEETGTTSYHVDNIETKHSKVYDRNFDTCEVFIDYEYEENENEG